MLHTGYHTVPAQRMVWEQLGDCHNPFIAKAIRRDTLEDVMGNIHFADNNLVDNDTFYKVHFNLT